MTIYLEDICKAYQGKEVLKQFQLQVEWNKCYALIGAEGTGKSTVLKIFMGTEKPDAGAVHRMGDYKYPTLQSAYVSQEGQLNVKKNAIWNVKKAHRWASKGRAVEELSRFLPDERQNIPVMELSQVERRYVELVRAFFIPADFIVLDEPFEGMNEDERRKALDYILENRGSRPLLAAARSEEGFEFAKIIRMGPF